MEIVSNEKYNRLFLNWLISLILLIALMIVVGGLTRLTDSGLSITEWQLFSGIIPPITQDDWINYFNLYKKIPEFEIQNYISRRIVPVQPCFTGKLKIRILPEDGCLSIAFFHP